MDAPQRADANRAGDDGAGQEVAEDPQGRASAFRRALDAQVEVDNPGQVLVPTGPHDLTVSVERARILEALAGPRPDGTQPAAPPPTQARGPEAETEAGAKDPQTRMPDWLPQIHWVGAADGAVDGGNGTAENVEAAESAAPVGARADSPAALGHGAVTSRATTPAVPGDARVVRQGSAVAAAVSATPPGVAVELARISQKARASRPEQSPQAGSPSGPSPIRGKRRKPGWLWLAVLGSSAVAAGAVIMIMLINGGSGPGPMVPSGLPTGTVPSNLAALPAAGPSGGKSPARPTATAKGTVTASSKSSPAASASVGSVDATAKAAAKAKAGSPVDETASPSVSTGTVPVLSSASASASAATATATAGAADESELADATGGCLNTPGSTYTSGVVEEVSDCGAGAFQTWTPTSSGQLTQDGGAYCLDDYGWGTTPGSEVDLWPCNGGTNQQWTIESDGAIVGVYSDLCLSLTGQGAAVELEQCDGQASQQWSWH